MVTSLRLTRIAAVFAIAFLTAMVPAALAHAQETQFVDCGEYEGVVCSGWFTDDAQVVADDQRVEDAIDRLVGRFGNQIAFVIVTESPNGEPLVFARELGNAWGVGDATRNDGIVVLVDLDARRTEVTTGPGVDIDEARVAVAGDSFFAVGDFEGGALAIVGSIAQELEFPSETADDSETASGPTGDGGGFGTTLLALAAVGGAAVVGVTYVARRNKRRRTIETTRRELVDGDLASLRPAGHELPQVDEYALAVGEGQNAATTAQVVRVVTDVGDGEPVTDGAATLAAAGHDLITLVDSAKLAVMTEVPLELRAADERNILEDAVQTAADDALAVDIDDEAAFNVGRQELQRLIASLRPHRVAAARQRTAESIINSMAETPQGDAIITDAGTRFVRSSAALDMEATIGDSIDEISGVYAEATDKTNRLKSVYEGLPDSAARPAVAAALADIGADPDDAVAAYEEVRTQLEREGAALAADGLSVPAIAALLMLNNDDDDVGDFIEAYTTNRDRGTPPDEAVEYALAGLRTKREIDFVRQEAERLDLPVSITAALLRRRDDGPTVYRRLSDQLASHDVAGETRKTIAGILAISLEPAQAIRRWLDARQALDDLGLEGAYADVAAAFGASDARGPRVFALAYAAQRQALARSTIEDADRFAPELAHAGTSKKTDTWTGEPIPRGLSSFDPFTLLYYHWIITRGHHGSFGWERIYRDDSWAGDRDSWWGGTGGFGGWGGGGGFSGGGGSSWGGSSWGGGGGFGGFGGGGGFSGGGGSGW